MKNFVRPTKFLLIQQKFRWPNKVFRLLIKKIVLKGTSDNIDWKNVTFSNEKRLRFDGSERFNY